MKAAYDELDEKLAKSKEDKSASVEKIAQLEASISSLRN